MSCQAKLDRPEYATVKRSLSEIGINSASDCGRTTAGRESDMARVSEGRADSTTYNDMRRSQVSRGLGLNLYQSDRFYADILHATRNIPDCLFSGSDRLNAAACGRRSRTAPGSERL